MDLTKLHEMIEDRGVCEIDKKIAQRKHGIAIDSLTKVVPASKYLFLDHNELEDILENLKKPEGDSIHKSNIKTILAILAGE